MLAHYACDLTPLLEQIAIMAAKTVGVILLSPDRAFTDAFVATQARPDHFSIVTAPLDSPWIRDRSPIAIREGGSIRWCVPRWAYESRPNDTELFSLIAAQEHPPAPIDYLPQGNLVAGRNGVVFVSRSLLKKNQLTARDMLRHNEILGVRQWLVFDSFSREPTGHADIHVRVLKPKLYAVAWNLSSTRDQKKAERLIAMIGDYDAGAEVLRIPIRSNKSQYASVLNWLQLGRRLLIPRYSLTPAEDVKTITAQLQAHGFRCEYLYSPTLDIQGSIHCLTASIFV